MRYIIFGRVSKKYQMVENQMYECRLWVDSKKTATDEVFEFEEPDTSSRKKAKARPVLSAMLKFIKRGDTLVIYKLDRLSRTGELTTIYDELIDRGVIVYSVLEPQADKLMVHLYCMGAILERESISRRTTTSLAFKRSKGEKVGRGLYGYKTDPSRLQLKNDWVPSFEKPYILIPDEKEQAALELMKKWFHDGCSYLEICRGLERHGHLNREGKQFQPASVHRIMRRLEKAKIVDPGLRHAAMYPEALTV